MTGRRGTRWAIGLGVAMAVAACSAPASSSPTSSSLPPAPGSTARSSAALVDPSPSALAASPSPVAPSTRPSPIPGHLTYVPVGDSLLYALNEDCGGCSSAAVGFGAQMAKDLGMPVDVHNLTMHNGLTSSGLLSYLENNAPAGRAEEPIVTALGTADVVSVTIGFNDIGSNDGPRSDALVKALEANLDAVLDAIVAVRAGAPTAIRVTLIYNNGIAPDSAADPDGPGSGVTFWRPIVEAQNAAICRSAERHAAACVDIYHPFNGKDGLASPAGRGLLGPDGTHPSQKGQDTIAAALVAAGYAPLR